MLSNFWVAFNVVAPMAMLMMVGAGVRAAGIIDRPSMRQFDRLLFRLFMPMLLFKNIYEADVDGSVSGKLVAFAVVGMLAVFALALLVPPRFVADHNQAASVGQAIVRSNYILFGIAVSQSLFGASGTGTVALLGAVAVPTTNALAVIILELNRSGRASPGKLLLSILKNPMVIAALLALSCKGLGIVFPEMVYSVMVDIANVTTTVSFLSLGVSLDLGEARRNRRPLALGLVFRMLVVPAVFLPLSVVLGFRREELCTLMVLFAAPSAVASYPMAVAMGADGPLAGQLVCTTTVTSVLTIFCYTLILRTLGFL